MDQTSIMTPSVMVLVRRDLLERVLHSARAAGIPKAINDEACTALSEQPSVFGEEVEVLAVVTLGGYFSSEELGDIDIEPQMQSLERIQQEVVRSDSDEHIELIDRTHIAPLRAEIEHLRLRLKIVEGEKQVLSDANASFADRSLENQKLKVRVSELEAQQAKNAGLLFCTKGERERLDEFKRQVRENRR